MRVVSVITDIEVVDRILDHLERRGHDARAPQAAWLPEHTALTQHL